MRASLSSQKLRNPQKLNEKLNDKNLTTKFEKMRKILKKTVKKEETFLNEWLEILKNR